MSLDSAVEASARRSCEREALDPLGTLSLSNGRVDSVPRSCERERVAAGSPSLVALRPSKDPA